MWDLTSTFRIFNKYFISFTFFLLLLIIKLIVFSLIASLWGVIVMVKFDPHQDDNMCPSYQVLFSRNPQLPKSISEPPPLFDHHGATLHPEDILNPEPHVHHSKTFTTRSPHLLTIFSTPIAPRFEDSNSEPEAPTTDPVCSSILPTFITCNAPFSVVNYEQ